MDNKKIIEIIKNEGATLDCNYDNFVSNRGYMVSLQGQEVKVDKNDIQGIKKEIERKRESKQISLKMLNRFKTILNGNMIIVFGEMILYFL